MLKAYLTCVKELYQFPRKIIKKEKNVKFDKKYCGLFEKIYEVFGYNLYLEQNISKAASAKKIKQAKQNLFKNYGEKSKEYLKGLLF